jgi:hypothetical protein
LELEDRPTGNASCITAVLNGWVHVNPRLIIIYSWVISYAAGVLLAKNRQLSVNCQ